MQEQRIHQKSRQHWCQSHPLLQPLIATEELIWFNPKRRPFAEVERHLLLGPEDIEDAAARLLRFAPYIAQVFPETAAQQGLIESPLIGIPQAQQALEQEFKQKLPGTLLLKCDSHLPISGSIKARGGIYEVLKLAETLALDAGLLTLEADYRSLAGTDCRTLFGGYEIVVGSTGNLGLSIGIMGAQLGFSVTVHMSADAQSWKKALLRSKGVCVVEHSADYGAAVEQGRLQAQRTPNCHFVDDENSQDLFLGYSVAAQRLKQQLDEQGVRVDQQHPLFVYLPCGVGGAPGGVAFGLKQLFGDAVHCFFAEPTHSPCMLLGMYTQLHDQISVGDFGIDNQTCADGLAVGRPSAFVGRQMDGLLDGIYTVADASLYRMLALLSDTEALALEPSALAGLPGPARIMTAGAAYLQDNRLATVLNSATHVVWATGGNMVPEQQRAEYYQRGKALLAAPR